MLQRLRNSFASMNEMVRQQERAAHNLANANTTGFKRVRAFTEVLQERIDHEGSPESARTQQHQNQMEQGALEPTGNALDVALEGEGFFVLDGPGGEEQYTRAGRFSLSDEGTLQTFDGRPVQGDGGPIQIPNGAGPVEIARDGRVQAGGVDVGQLRIVRFDDPGALRPLDGIAFAADGQMAEPADARVHQGHLEASNVDTIQEMTDMIAHMRLFESQQKVITTTDQILGQVTQQLGKF